MWKPMLAGTIPPPFILSPSRFPLLVSRKLDGVRATIQDGKVMSRSLKLIQNRYVQEMLGVPALENLDGELIVGDPTAEDAFRVTTSAVCSLTGTPMFTFYVFDKFGPETFDARLQSAQNVVDAFQKPDMVRMVEHLWVLDPAQLIEIENRWVEQGHEGAMIRSGAGPYKQGRSTVNEGWLCKLKRFVDSEGLVVGMNELMHNDNVAITNELGHTARSSHKANMIPAGMLGGLIVKDLKTGVTFTIGTGFNEGERIRIWKDREMMVGRVAKYKYFASGSKDKPRFPVWKGWRDPVDMDTL